MKSINTSKTYSSLCKFHNIKSEIWILSHDLQKKFEILLKILPESNDFTMVWNYRFLLL